MIIAFIGHSEIAHQDRVQSAVKEQISGASREAAEVVCYVGGYGDYDEICARACRELKSERGGIEVVYVTPYISPDAQVRIRKMQNDGMIDTSVYPPLECVPPRFAILKRNEWMMKNADLVIAYVKREYGGAYKALCVARRLKKPVINLAEIL